MCDYVTVCASCDDCSFFLAMMAWIDYLLNTLACLIYWNGSSRSRFRVEWQSQWKWLLVFALQMLLGSLGAREWEMVKWKGQGRVRVLCATVSVLSLTNDRQQIDSKWLVSIIDSLFWALLVDVLMNLHLYSRFSFTDYTFTAVSLIKCASLNLIYSSSIKRARVCTLFTNAFFSFRSSR